MFPIDKQKKKSYSKIQTNNLKSKLPIEDFFDKVFSKYFM